MTAAIREAIRDRALGMGFDAVGFAEARLAGRTREDLGEFLRRGYHGDMGWLAGTAARSTPSAAPSRSMRAAATITTR
jgi:epoxyqueuosine reductase